MKAEVVTITPTQAEQWLARNTHNRNLREPYVRRLSDAIRRGEWQFNGEAIKFNGDGTLLDGQHRLAAVVETGISITTLVVHDVSMAAQDTMDVGARRSLGDALKLRGETEYSALAGSLTVLWRYDTGRERSNLTPTIIEGLATLERHPGIRASIPVGRRANSWIKYPNSSGAALHYMFSRLEAEDADDFFNRLTTGTRLDEGNPILTLRRAVERDAQQPRRMPVVKLQAITIKAWNAYRNGQTIHLLKWAPGGAKPEPFPVAT